LQLAVAEAGQLLCQGGCHLTDQMHPEVSDGRGRAIGPPQRAAHLGDGL
jgi:hypothetical protein